MAKSKAHTQLLRGDAHLTTRIKTQNFRPNSDEPDWSRCCSVCGATPIVPLTGMCGPCTFGESDTAGGNW